MDLNFDNGNNRKNNAFVLPQVETVIKPNMEEYVKKLKIYIMLSYIGIAISFISFGIIGFIMVSDPFGGFSPIIFLPFLGFSTCSILSAILTPRFKMAQAIISVINQIKSSDKIDIIDISYTFKNFKGDVLHIIRLLIATGNLNGYQIIENRIVAKESEYVKPIENEYPKLYICDGCNAEIQDTDAYCPKCGRKRYR